MKNWHKQFVFFLFLLICFKPCYGQNKWIGYWIDTIETYTQDLKIVIHFDGENQNEMKLNLYSIDQSKVPIPIKSFQIKEDSLVFSSKAYNLQFKGQFVDSNSSISGVFKQGQVFPLQFTRIDSLPCVYRPQTPQPPFDYGVEEVLIPNKKAKVNLAGTLTIPKNCRQCPAVVLVAGSGPQDRDENIFDHKPFAVIADMFTKNGIAVLRYDKRGIGKSTGELYSATTFDFAEDAQATVDFLKKDKRFQTIGIVGHSEGGIIAAMLAAQPKSKLDFAVLLAAPAQKGDSLIVSQVFYAALASNLNENYAQAVANQERFLLDVLMKHQDSTLTKIDEELDKHKQSLPEDDIELALWKNFVPLRDIPPCLSPWFQTFLTINPADYLQKVKIPVFALYGSKDCQVPPETNKDLMFDYLSKSNIHFSLITLNNKNHLFQNAKTGSVKEYNNIAETIAYDVLSMIKNWILELKKY